MVFSGGQFIGGIWVKGKGTSFRSINPADGSIVWEGASASPSDIDFAFMSARHAFLMWSRETLDRRIAIIRNYQAELVSHRRELAELISQEVGKPLWESDSEVGAMIGKIDISIDAYYHRTGEIELSASPRTRVRHRPHGVMAVLGPFNFPGHLPNGHVVPALIAGNTVVFKPSDYTPMVGLFMGALLEKAGVPKGVFNVVNGAAGVGQRVVAHSELDGLCFTGSASVGRQLAASFGRMPEKIVALEMGGNNPMILHSADHVLAAALTIFQSAFLTSGQRCTCARRLIMVNSAPNRAILDRLSELVDQVDIGIYSQRPEPFMGPVISESTAQRLTEVVADLKRRGASVLGLQRMTQGAFMYPTLINVSVVTHRSDEEYFGPILQVIEVDTLEEAIQVANHTRYGLSAGVLSSDPEVFTTCETELRTGIVNWNVPTTGASSKAPFGGVGGSGNHRPTAFYAADYCAYPVVSTMSDVPIMPATTLPGVRYLL